MYNCTLILLNRSNKLVSSQRTYIIFPSNICTTSMSVYTLPTTTTCKSCPPIVASHMAQILPTSMSIYTLPITCFFNIFFVFLYFSFILKEITKMHFGDRLVSMFLNVQIFSKGMHTFLSMFIFFKMVLRCLRKIHVTRK